MRTWRANYKGHTYRVLTLEEETNLTKLRGWGFIYKAVGE